MGSIKAAAAIPVAIAVALLFVVVLLFDDDTPEAGSHLVATAALDPRQVPSDLARLIETTATECDAGLPASVLAAQLKQESGFNPDAVGPPTDYGRAEGIAQFIPSTWESSGVDGNGDGAKDPFDPEDAIAAQGQMMCKLLTTAKKHPDYRGSPIELALAGYNAGWGWVEYYRGVPPERFSKGQTYHYVNNIMAMQAEFVDDRSSAAPGSYTAPIDAPLGAAGYRATGSSWSSGRHTGIDFSAPTGTAVNAIQEGTVVSAGWAGAYGDEIVIKHPDGHYSQYAHLSALRVQAGQQVRPGQEIARSGATGNTTGPHLHFEIRTGRSYGTDINPLTYLRRHGIDP